MGEARAVARYIRISPRKARYVADLVRGKKVDEAMNILRFTRRGASRVVRKVLASAVANATENHKMDELKLYISRVYVDEGPTLKRFRPRARGRATRIRKRTSHVTVWVTEKGEG
jgi:large subunit ribosomal protein L22